MNPKKIILLGLVTLILSKTYGQQVVTSFQSPDTVCVNTLVNFTNTSTGSVNDYYWNICNGSLPATAQTSSFVNTNFSAPVYLDIINDGGMYYIFVANNVNGKLTRLDYGTSLNNTPTATDLGFVLSNLEDIHIEKEGTNWYGIAVGGISPGAICRLNFGNSITNVPTVLNMGNIGTLSYPHTLIMFKSGGNCYGITFNQSSNTLTRFDFGNSIANTPTGTNLGNIGNIASPSQMVVINSAGNWYGYICNDAGSPSITRLDFGNSLLNVPTGTNIGNPNGLLNGPRGLAIWTECDGIKGLLGNKNNNTLIELNFPAGPSGSISATPFSGTPTLSYPQTIKRYRIGDGIAYYIVNVFNNSLTRIYKPNCSSLNSSTLQTPSPVTFSVAGTYSIYLNTNESEYNQSQYCKSIVVLSSPQLTLSGSQTICYGGFTTLSVTGASTYTWSTNANSSSIVVSPSLTTSYTVTASNNYQCKAEKTVTVVVSECTGISEVVKSTKAIIYPNPSNGEINIETSKPIEINLYNSIGMLLMNTHITVGKHTQNLSELNRGVYILKLSDGVQTQVVKLIKE